MYGGLSLLSHFLSVGFVCCFHIFTIINARIWPQMSLDLAVYCDYLNGARESDPNPVGWRKYPGAGSGSEEWGGWWKDILSLKLMVGSVGPGFAVRRGRGQFWRGVMTALGQMEAGASSEWPWPGAGPAVAVMLLSVPCCQSSHRQLQAAWPLLCWGN